VLPDFYKQKIFQVHRTIKILSVSPNFDFDVNIEFPDINKPLNVDEFAEFTKQIILLFGHDKNDVIQYHEQFKTDDFTKCYFSFVTIDDIDKNCTLGRIDDTFKYLGLIEFYFYLIAAFQKVSAGGTIEKPLNPRLIDYRFQTIFPESVPDLYEQLNAKGLIKTTEIHFVWAFGIGKDKPTDFKPIVWSGENTLLAYLIYKICENNNKPKVAEMIFGVKGLAQTFTNCKGDPRGKELIDDILLEIG